MIKVALVGCGRISKRHTTVLAQVEGAKLAAVCDVLPVKARETGDRYKVPWFTDMETMVGEAQPDLISILTPSGHHAAHIRRLAPFGIPILVEKPLVLRLEDVDIVIDACKRHGTELGEVKQNRYNNAVQYLAQSAMWGLGRPHLASARVWWSRRWPYYSDWHGRWDMAGGVLANQAIHHIDLLWWLLGNVRRVSAFAAYSPHALVETTLVATLEFESGCIGTIEATTLATKDIEGSLAIIGGDGFVELGGFAVNEVRRWALPDFQEPPVGRAENPPDVYGFGHLKMYQYVVKNLEAGNGFPINAHEARKSIEIAHAIYESVETGRVIELTGDYPNSRLGK